MPQDATTLLHADEKCVVCAHSWDAHDALGVRFCTATGSSGLTRGCICG